MNKPHGAMDSASDFGSDGWGFESLWGCFCLLNKTFIKDIYFKFRKANNKKDS